MNYLLRPSILVVYFFIISNSCEKPSARGDTTPLASTPCYAVTAQDGYDDLVCSGKPIKQRPGPSGPEGPRGPTGGPGPKGDPGSSGSARSIFRTCATTLSQWPGISVKYTIFNVGVDRESLVTIEKQSGPDAGVFSNTSIFLKDDTFFFSCPVDVQEFDIHLVSDKEALISSRISSATSNFQCN